MEVREVVRFLSDEEACEGTEKELGQPPPKDIIDILVTSRPTQPAKKISTSVVNLATNDPSAESVMELAEVAGSDLETEANDHSTMRDMEQAEEPGNDLVKRRWRRSLGTTWRRERRTLAQRCANERVEEIRRKRLGDTRTTRPRCVPRSYRTTLAPTRRNER